MKPVIAAQAAAEHPASFAPDWVLWILGAYFGLLVLGVALSWVARFMPSSKWRTRLGMMATVVQYPVMALTADNKNMDAIRAQGNNLFAVWFKRHVGMPITVLNADGSIDHTGIAKTWWDGDIIGGLMPPWTGWINVSELIRRGGQMQRKDGGYFFTSERWAKAEPELRAAKERQRANFSKEVTDALDTLGLTTSATLSDITDARNRLIKANHPDNGGSTAMAQRINAAHDLLRSIFLSEAA
jgi:hypothetical protein